MTKLRHFCRGAGMLGGTALVLLVGTQTAIASSRSLEAAARQSTSTAKITVTGEDYIASPGAWPVRVFANYEKLQAGVGIRRSPSTFGGYKTKFLEQASSGALRVTLGLFKFVTNFTADWGAISSVLLAAIPSGVCLILAQRWIATTYALAP